MKVNSFLLDKLKQLKINNSEFIFAIPRTGLPPSSSAVNQFLRKAIKEIGLNKPDFHFHSLRHTHVSYLISQGIDIAAISKRLGHANIAITLSIYAHLLDEYKDQQDAKIINSLNQVCATFVQHREKFYDIAKH
nr:tyrosine-type recombinase/integrase [Lactobacillus crispatus]